MDCIDVDWKKIKAEYIAGGTSYRKLADKYGVSRSKLQARATREKWVDLQSQAQAKIDAKTVDLISDIEAERAVSIDNVADKLLEKIFNMLDSGATAYNTQNIKNLTSALKDIKDIKGFKSELDTQEQKARIAKLNRDAERGGSESDSPCGVVLLPAVLTAPMPPCEEDADG